MSLARPYLLLLAVATLHPGPAWSQDEEGRTGTGVIIPTVIPPQPSLHAPPVPPRDAVCEECDERNERLLFGPRDPSVRLDTLHPTTAESHGVLRTAAPQGVRGPGTFTFFKNTPLSVVSFLANGAVSSTNEPSVSVDGKIVYYTGNWYCAYSMDGGTSFIFRNPYDNFPSDGAIDQLMGGPFCCDQVTYYEKTRGSFFWLLQYSVGSLRKNGQRIAVAPGQASIVNNSWVTYAFQPSSFGFPDTGRWLDYPDLAVSNKYLYYTTNIFLLTQSTTNTGVVVRIPLDEIASGRPITYSYVITSFTPRLTKGATTTMYFASHISNTRLRVYRWDDDSSSVPSDIIVHNAFNNTDTMKAPLGDGTDWAQFSDSRVHAAYVANGEVGFMWNAAQTGSFPYPYVFSLRLRESDRSILTQGEVWSSQYALLYPSVHPNDRGDLGGTIALGGGSQYPSAAAWIADDFNNRTVAPLEIALFSTGTAGPSGNRWGDYLAARQHVPYGNTWAGSGYALTGTAPNLSVVPSYVWFGRERDTPPPGNTIYVNINNTTGIEDGTFLHPYAKVGTAHTATVPNDTLVVMPGSYNEAPRLTRAGLTVRGYGGVANVGLGVSSQPGVRPRVRVEPAVPGDSAQVFPLVPRQPNVLIDKAYFPGQPKGTKK